MLIIFTLYISILAYLAKQIVDLSNQYKNEMIEQNNDIKIFNIPNLFNISNDDPLYVSIVDECIKNKINTNEKVIVSCTGDKQSMAMLAIIINLFGSRNVNVITINHHQNIQLSSFVHDICDINNLKFYNYNVDLVEYYNNHLIKQFRYEKIRNICKKEDIRYIFEAHTSENYSNSILENMFSETLYESNIINNQIYYPFLSKTNEDIENFYNNYPLSHNDIHYNYSMVQNKQIFNEFDDLFTMLYPEWRHNIIKSYLTTKNIVDNEYNNIHNIINKNCIISKYGFIYYHDLKITPYDIYKMVITGLCDELNINHLSDLSISNMYASNDYFTIYLIDDLNEQFQHFYNYLQNMEPSKFIEQFNKAEEELTHEFENLNTNSSEENSNDMIEYLYCVNILDNSDEYDINKIENNNNINIKEELINGKVYFSLIDNKLKISYE
jgi:hypothetical protein